MQQGASWGSSRVPWLQLETVYVLEGLGPPPDDDSDAEEHGGAKSFEDQARAGALEPACCCSVACVTCCRPCR